MKNKPLIIFLLILVVAIGLAVFLVTTPEKPGEYDTFAKCLGEKGVKFYGAFWCPNCQNQKAMFGRSAKKLPYVECSTPDGKGQTSECNELNITAYPTWIFASGEKTEGVMSLEMLSEKTECALLETNV